MSDPGKQLSTINIHSIVSVSATNGPGSRTVVWVQGCVFRCQGCFNEELIPFVGKKQMEIDAIMKKIPTHEVEGVTISGGEPFCQAEGLALFAEEVKKAGLSLMVYTGFLYKDLLASPDPATNRFLSHIDVLVDGPYIRDVPSRNVWSGSGNQCVLFLTKRYNKYKDRIEPGFRMAEYHINADGSVVETGF
jgi:anaerobic ribonucleoside-triphosphate reductase activating protein